MILKHKTIPLIKLEEAQNGRLEGIANAFDVLDSYGEITVRGAFADSLADFVTKGYLLADHDWSMVEGVVGYIVDASEDETGLRFAAEFHSDPTSQRLRTIALERMAAGKEVGLSIGYWEIEAANETRDGETVRILKKLHVKEVSLVVAQANHASMATGAKARRPDAYAALKEQGEAYIQRVLEINELGRGASSKEARREELEALALMFQQAADGLLPGIEPVSIPQAELELALAQLERFRGAALGA